MSKIKQSAGDRIFDVINVILCIVLFLLILYPLIYVLSASVSDPYAVLQGKMTFLPVGFNLDAYAKIFEYEDVLTGYKNSLILVLLGTGINFILTFFGAYPLSRKDLYGRTFLTVMFAITMFFNGGMIPRYLVVQDCHLLDTVWSMIIPTAISMYNLVVMRTFFQSNIPDSLVEAAEIDGASNWQIMIRVVLPLSKSIIAVICLFYGVAHWNQYFQAPLYLSSSEKYPLQMVLREILLLSQVQDLVDTQDFANQVMQGESIKYSLIVVASVPVLAVYPFIQKHFVKGVMLGAIKG